MTDASALPCRARDAWPIRFRCLAFALQLLVFPICLRGAETTPTPLAAASTNAPAFVDPAPMLRPEAREAVLAFRFSGFIPPALRIPDGYMDGGHGMGVFPDGRLTSSREILIVDREKDAGLREHIAYARSPETAKLEPRARAVRLGVYVDALFSKCGKNAMEAATDGLAAKYRNRGVLLGDVVPLCGGGVCRHRTLLLKVLADEAGLSVSMVRGKYRHSDGRLGQHAWNELYLDDGTVLLMDVTSPPRGWAFPRVQDARAGKYLGQGADPLYGKSHVVWPPYLRALPVDGAARERLAVTIQPPEAGAPVFYTLDGTEPTKDSTRYDKPIELHGPGTVRAAAIYADGFVGRMAEAKVQATATAGTTSK